MVPLIEYASGCSVRYSRKVSYVSPISCLKESKGSPSNLVMVGMFVKVNTVLSGGLLMNMLSSEQHVLYTSKSSPYPRNRIRWSPGWGFVTELVISPTMRRVITSSEVSPYKTLSTPYRDIRVGYRKRTFGGAGICKRISVLSFCTF